MSDRFDTENVKVKVVDKDCKIPTQQKGSRIISFYNNSKEKVLLPFKREIVNTGYILSFAHDYVLQIHGDPQLSQLNGLKVIESFHERSKDTTLRITLFNTSDTRVVVKPYQKIAEGVLVPAGATNIQVVKNIEF